MTTVAPIVSLQQASLCYPGHPEGALHTVDFALHPGERIALTGDNGSGKTTLLLALTGLRPLSVGTLLHHGEAVTTPSQLQALRKDVGIVFQNAEDQLFSPTVLEDVAFGPLNLGFSQAEAQTQSEAVLARLGVADLAPRLTHTLSGGQQRMVALATALVMAPKALLLDEPTNDLDATGRATLIKILRESGLALVLSSHEPGFLETLATRTVRLEQGRIAG